MSGQMKSQKRKPVIRVKQHITPDLKIDNTTPIHPPTHTHEDLTVVQGGSNQLNARQILNKNDVNSY